MTKSNTLVSYCVKRITPAAAALVLALTGGSAFATPQEGATALNAKLNSTYFPTIKADKPATTLTAKEADLLFAIELVLQDPANTVTPADIAAGVLAEVGTKTRSDKDKIAPKVLATVAASADLSADDTALAAVFKALYEINGTNKTALSATGKGNLIAAAVKVAGNDETATSIGTQLAASFTSAEPNKDLLTLLQNTSKALGKTVTAEAAENLEDLVKGLLDAPSPDVAENTQVVFIQELVKKVASSNPGAAGAYIGGLIEADPGQIFSTNPTTTDTNLKGIATFALTSSSKASKAVGEILAQLTAYSDKKDLAVFLAAQNTSNAKNPLIAQGLIRASDDLDEVKDILDAFPAIDPVKFAASAVVGSADDDDKLTKIISTLASKPALDVKKKTSLGLGAISAVGGVEATSAATITTAVLNSGGFTDNAARLKFGTDIISKIKAYPAAGQVAGAIVEASINTPLASGLDGRIGIATALMTKASKAGPDIAQQIFFAGTQVSTDDLVLAPFVDSFADTGLKLLQPIAMGLSMATPTKAGSITAWVINHSGTVDKNAVSKAVSIAGAVAGVVDEEQVANIAFEVSKLMTPAPAANNPTSTAPLKLSTVTSLATSLAKALQAKPGVVLANRMDELGELAATLVSNVLGKVAPAGTTDAKLLKTENGYITGIGTAIIKTLSKTLRLPGDPAVDPKSGLVVGLSKLSADLWEASDIAGSIARAIQRLQVAGAIDLGRVTSLIGTNETPGLLEVALLKVAGKKGSSTYVAVETAFSDIRSGTNVTRFEDGSDRSTSESSDNNG